MNIQGPSHKSIEERVNKLGYHAPEILKPKQIKEYVFKETLKSTLSWVPNILAGPFAALKKVGPEGGILKFAKIALLAPLAVLASIHVATFLLIGAPAIAAAALLNARSAANKGKDIHGKAVVLEMKGLTEVRVTTERLGVGKGEQSYDESGAKISPNSALYKDILKYHKMQDEGKAEAYSLIKEHGWEVKDNNKTSRQLINKLTEMIKDIDNKSASFSGITKDKLEARKNNCLAVINKLEGKI